VKFFNFRLIKNTVSAFLLISENRTHNKKIFTTEVGNPPSYRYTIKIICRKLINNVKKEIVQGMESNEMYL